MPNKFTIAEDFEFAKESGEFVNDATLLRYVAAINPEATRDEFVAAAIAAGYAGNSTANRFRESRHESISWGEMDGHPVAMHKDGRLLPVA